MYFESFSEFLAMGGHALYVWLAYGATALVIIGFVFSIRFRRKKLLEAVAWEDERADAEPLGGQVESEA